MPKYVRLDDDVSFQILRTNPKLTTNTKLMYDGENLFMESYPAVPLLSTMEYKHHRIWKTGLYNMDIRNFLLGTNTAAYAVGRDAKDTIILDNFDNQFENMYWCGVESINSKFYPHKMGCIAPLYLRKKRPNYFVIFKIDNLLNTDGFNFKKIQKNAKIVKSFNLREGTPIGNYIKRYVEQRDFKYDQSIYVNFSSNEIYYYGIDKKSGVLTQKVENFEEPLLKNDNTIMKVDNWITSGFERNNLIFPYIINFEFLFDDNDIEEFKFAKYFGMYCNDINLYNVNIKNEENDKEKSEENDKEKSKETILYSEWETENNITTDDCKFYYIKDKYKNIYSVNSTNTPGHFKVPGNVNYKDFRGFEPSTVSTYAERLNGVGNAFMILEIKKTLEFGDTIKISNTIYNKEEDENQNITNITTSEQTIGTFIATNELAPGESYDCRFSCKGTKVDIAHALARAIVSCDINEFRWLTAFNIDNKVIIKAKYPGSNMNDLFDVTFDKIITNGGKIEKLTSFTGGTDRNGCMFKVYTYDKDMFFDYESGDGDVVRYVKCGFGKDPSEIIAFVPYITEDRKIDDEYSIIITDYNGQYANVSRTNQIEIMDKYHAEIGVLSFFPVKDFDFDTVSSAYGECSLMKKELDKIAKYKDKDTNKDVESFKIPYGRFFYDNNNDTDKEYDYFFENIVPELTTVNKTVPFINKWGYVDDSKDSCENVYRLNTSKIFDACNFSANTFMQKGDIMEYTHSMPYYVNLNYKSENHTEDDFKNEYQYLDVINETLSEYTTTGDINGWIEYFSKRTADGKDPFDELFGDTSKTKFTNKRFNKKYSRFLMGNDVNRSSTLFRGVKFEIVELKDGEEVHTGKYNNYRFSFIYVPILLQEDEEDNHTVYFIKNDKLKFIVGIVFFNTENDLQDKEFNKAFVYAKTMGFYDLYYVEKHGNQGSGDPDKVTDENP